MSHRLALLLLFLPLFCSSSSNADEYNWFLNTVNNQKPIPKLVTLLQSNWLSTSLLAEASEFIATESHDQFESFVDTINRDSVNLKWEKLSEKSKYEYTINTASRILSKSSMKFLKLSLGLRQFSPKVHSFQKIAEEYGYSNCSTFIVVNGRGSCDVEKCNEMLENREEAEKVFETDHIFREKNATSVVILYGELGTVSFSKAFKNLRSMTFVGGFKLIFRHYSNTTSPHYVDLSGYGAELRVKSDHLIYDTIKEGPFLEEEQYRNISLALMSFVFNSERNRPLEDLQTIMGFLPRTIYAVHGRLPRDEYSHRLYDLIKGNIWEEMFANRIALKEIGVSEGECTLYINGIKIDMKDFDLFDLVNVLRREQKLIDALYSLGVHNETNALFSGLDYSYKKRGPRSEYGIDYRRAKPFYLNDLETGVRYESFNRNYSNLTQDMFGNVQIRRNLLNLVFVIDPLTREGLLLMKKCVYFIANEISNIPMRVGVVLVVNDDPLATAENDVSVAVYTLWNYFYQSYSVGQALEYFLKFLSEQDGKLSVGSVKSYLKSIEEIHMSDLVFKAGSTYATGKEAGAKLLRNADLTREEFDKKPMILLNGFLLKDVINGQDVNLDGVYHVEMAELAKSALLVKKHVEYGLQSGTLTDEMDAESWILKTTKIVPTMNKRIWEAANAQNYVDLSGSKPCMSNLTIYENLKLPGGFEKRCLLNSIGYVQNNNIVDTVPVTIVVVADVETEDGLRFVQSAVRMIETSNKTRVGIILNPSNNKTAFDEKTMSFYILSAFENKTMEERRLWLLNSTNKKAFEEFQQSNINFKIATRIGIEGLLPTELFGIKMGQKMIVANGLKIGPLDENENFDLEDFQFLETELISRGAETIPSLLKKWEFDTRNGAGSNAVVSITSFIGNYGSPRQRVWPKLAKTNHSSAIVRPNRTNEGVFDVVATVDPALLIGQKLGRVLTMIKNNTNSYFRVIWNPLDTLSEFPIQKSYYEYAIREKLEFDEDGSLQPFNVYFEPQTRDQFVSWSIQVPKSWVVEVNHTKIGAWKQSLDLSNININMAKIKENHTAVFSLKHLLVEGYCKEHESGETPNGLHLNLTTKEKSRKSQTTVINDGYFQLKANPGEWKLKIGEGRSSESYSLRGQHGDEDMENNTIPIFIDSFSGKSVLVDVVKKSGAVELGAPIEKEFKSLFPFGVTDENPKPVNVFSIASGHFEDRFLRVMIASVMNNTKNPVKLWLLDDMTSVRGKNTIRKMAKPFNFTYELVSYNWPSWMHPERETTRIFEGYKTLFIDVLFSLDVENVIFLSPFTLVRTDLFNLLALDLGNSAYGSISMPETNGNKMDSPFFIVNLPNFRRLLLGDQRRQQYRDFFRLGKHRNDTTYNVANVSIQQQKIVPISEEWLTNHALYSSSSETVPKIIYFGSGNNETPKIEMAQKFEDWKHFDSVIESEYVPCNC